MRRLVLVKHSMPDIDPDRPASAWGLSDIGRRRSETLASRLMDFAPEVIWSSREPKAVETADIVSGAFEVPVEVAAGLEERHRDNVPYLPSVDEFDNSIEQLFDNPDELVLGTETARQALYRLTAAINDVIETGQKDSIVVTHGTVISLFVAKVAGVRPICLWRRLGVPSYVVLAIPSMDIRSIVESTIVEGTPD